MRRLAVAVPVVFALASLLAALPAAAQRGAQSTRPEKDEQDETAETEQAVRVMYKVVGEEKAKAREVDGSEVTTGPDLGGSVKLGESVKLREGARIQVAQEARIEKAASLQVTKGDLTYRSRAGEELAAGRYDAAREILETEAAETAVDGAPGGLTVYTYAPEDLFQLAVADQLEAGAAGGDRELLDRAAARYQEVLVARPDAAAVHFNLAKVEEERGETGAALRALESAAAVDGPDRAFYVTELADGLGRNGRVEPAMERYAEALRLSPQSAAPHQRALELGVDSLARDADPLLDYLWRLLEEGESRRTAEAAVEALATGRGSRQAREELLTLVAAALGRSFLAPAEVVRSPVGEGLAALARQRSGSDRAAADLAEGAAQLLRLYRYYARPGVGARPLDVSRFDWWIGRGDTLREPERGVWPRTAFRADLRAVGEWYRQQGDPKVAESCYLASVDLVEEETDPAAFRDLVRLYSDRGDVDALLRLADRFQDAMFRGKGQAYRDSDLPKIYAYHRSLGTLYGHLAKRGEVAWGNEHGPVTSALFQLRRAYDLGFRLTPEETDGPAPDPAVVKLLAESLEATGDPRGAERVRQRAIERLREQGVEERRLEVLLAGS